MQRIQFSQLLYWFAFLVLGFFSCWWTADSLAIWQPALGTAGSWLVAVLFYVMASLCFSLLMNGFNKDYDFYGKFLGRGASIFVGLIGLLLFWLVCSMPTNTHTLLYNAQVKNTILRDINQTEGYLNRFKDSNPRITAINDQYDAKAMEVSAILFKMRSEMQDPSNKGIGRRFDLLVADLNAALATINPNERNNKTIQVVKNVGSTPAQWMATYRQYEVQVNNILKLYRTSCDEQITRIRRSINSEKLNEIIDNLNVAKADILKMKNVNNKVVDAALVDLTEAYAYIGDPDHSKMIIFDTPQDSLRYCAENAQPVTKSLQVVPKVWGDFFTTDKYDGLGFSWWILIALLVDVAGFIFFFLANKQS